MAVFDPVKHPRDLRGEFRRSEMALHVASRVMAGGGNVRPDLADSPGRSRHGRMRNYGAMTDAKLIGVLAGLTQYGKDPEAVKAAQEEAARRTGKKLKETTMDAMDRRAERRLTDSATPEAQEAAFKLATRQRLAKKGVALPDGSYPIRSESDLENAVQAYGRAKDKPRAKAHIVKRAKALGATGKLPHGWLKEAELLDEVEAEMIAEAADSLVKAHTPEPFSKSKTSNWVARSGGLPNYIQHVAHGLVRSGHSTSEAIQMAIGIVRRWARGGGKVDANTKAAAALAISQWEELKAKNAAKKASS